MTFKRFLNESMPNQFSKTRDCHYILHFIIIYKTILFESERKITPLKHNNEIYLLNLLT